MHFYVLSHRLHRHLDSILQAAVVSISQCSPLLWRGLYWLVLRWSETIIAAAIYFPETIVKNIVIFGNGGKQIWNEQRTKRNILGWNDSRYMQSEQKAFIGKNKGQKLCKTFFSYSVSNGLPIFAYEYLTVGKYHRQILCASLLAKRLKEMQSKRFLYFFVLILLVLLIPQILNVKQRKLFAKSLHLYINIIGKPCCD